MFGQFMNMAVQVDSVIEREQDAHPGLPCGTSRLGDGAASGGSRVFAGEPDL